MKKTLVDRDISLRCIYNVSRNDSIRSFAFLSINIIFSSVLYMHFDNKKEN